MELVMKCLNMMEGGEIFVPKIPSMKLVDMARAIIPNCDIKVVGIRPSEKLHEVLIPAGESHNTVEFDEYYVIQPAFSWWNKDVLTKTHGGMKVPDNFEFSSDKNTNWLTSQQLLALIES